MCKEKHHVWSVCAHSDAAPTKRCVFGRFGSCTDATTRVSLKLGWCLECDKTYRRDIKWAEPPRHTNLRSRNTVLNYWAYKSSKGYDKSAKASEIPLSGFDVPEALPYTEIDSDLNREERAMWWTVAGIHPEKVKLHTKFINRSRLWTDGVNDLVREARRLTLDEWSEYSDKKDALREVSVENDTLERIRRENSSAIGMARHHRPSTAGSQGQRPRMRRPSEGQGQRLPRKPVPIRGDSTASRAVPSGSGSGSSRSPRLTESGGESTRVHEDRQPRSRARRNALTPLDEPPRMARYGTPPPPKWRVQRQDDESDDDHSVAAFSSSTPDLPLASPPKLFHAPTSFEQMGLNPVSTRGVAEAQNAHGGRWSPAQCSEHGHYRRDGCDECFGLLHRRL